MGKELLTDLKKTFSIREGVQIKKTFLNGHCPFRGGGPPKGDNVTFFLPFFISGHPLSLSGALFPLPRTPNFRWLVQWHLWVYKFETCFLGSPNHPETALRMPKKYSNIFFLAHLVCISNGLSACAGWGIFPPMEAVMLSAQVFLMQALPALGVLVGSRRRTTATENNLVGASWLSILGSQGHISDVGSAWWKGLRFLLQKFCSPRCISSCSRRALPLHSLGSLGQVLLGVQGERKGRANSGWEDEGLVSTGQLLAKIHALGGQRRIHCSHFPVYLNQEN